MRKLFRATQAHVTGMTSTQFTFLIEETSRDAIVIDMTHATSGVSPTLVDDLRDLGGFSYAYGEPWGSTYLALGAFYLEYAHWLALADQLESGTDVPATFAPYELTAVYYTDSPGQPPGYAGERYHGFHATVRASAPPFLQVEVWPADEAHGGAGVTMWINVFDPGVTDAALGHGDAAYGTYAEEWDRISIDTTVGKSGSIYLNTRVLPEQPLLSVPKLPRSLGGPVTVPGDTPVIPEGMSIAASGDGWFELTSSATTTTSTARVATKIDGQRAPKRPGPSSVMLCRQVTPSPEGSVVTIGPGPAMGAASMRASNGNGGNHAGGKGKGKGGGGDQRPIRFVNVSGTNPYGELVGIQQRLGGGGIALVDDAAGLLAILQRWVECHPPPARRYLDLIGHAVTADNVLQLGRSILRFEGTPAQRAADPVHVAFSAIANQQLLPQLGIQTVRLIGCRTASTPVGTRALQELRTLLGVQVEGCFDLITLEEFSTTRFTGTTVAGYPNETHERVYLPMDPSIEPFGVTYSRNRASRAERAVIVGREDVEAVKAQVKAALEGGARSATPGLLARPSVQVYFPVTGAAADDFDSFEVLFDHEYVRVHRADATPLVYEVVDKDALRDAIQAPR